MDAMKELVRKSVRQGLNSYLGESPNTVIINVDRLVNNITGFVYAKVKATKLGDPIVAKLHETLKKNTALRLKYKSVIRVLSTFAGIKAESLTPPEEKLLSALILKHRIPK